MKIQMIQGDGEMIKNDFMKSEMIQGDGAMMEWPFHIWNQMKWKTEKAG